MKRFILLTSFTTLSMAASFAQNNTRYDRNTLRLEILQQQQRNKLTGQKPTAEKSRVTGSSSYTQGVISDSVRNHYTGTRGSDIDNVMDNMVAATSFYTPGFDKQINQCDSFTQWGIIENAPTIVPIFKGSFGYNNSGKLNFINLDILSFQTQYDLMYDAAGKLVQWTEIIEAGGAGNEIRTFRKYDSQGRKAADSSFDYSMSNAPMNKMVYHYDNAGNLTTDTLYEWLSGAWSVYATSEYIYDPQDRLEIAQYKDIENNGILENVARTNYLYTASNTYPTEESKEMWENNAWAGDEKNRYTFNTNGKPATLIHMLRVATPALDTVEKREIVYNQKGLVKDENFYKYENGNFHTAPYRTDHWYYETYNDGNPTDIKDVTFNENTVNLYPIPAGDRVTVAATKDRKINRLELYTTAGQLVQQYDCGNKAQFSFSVTNLPEGLYFLRSYTDKGNSAHRIVVEH